LSKVLEEQSSFRQIMKSTSILGGVQIICILVSIIRSKIIAVLVGTTGYGILGLLNSTVGLMTSLTNFGLGTIAVKNVAAACTRNDRNEISKVFTIIQKLVILTGLFGTVVTILLSRVLSELTFGNNDYTYLFVLLSISLLLTQLNVGQIILLQGTRNIKYLAKATLWGSLCGLLVSTPLYYYFRLNGIVPSIILSSVVTLTFSYYYANKIIIPTINVSFKKAFCEGRDILSLGFMLSLSFMISQASSYVIRAYISHVGSLEEVGLYTAGFAIISSYVGLIFSAMATDFYPKLSGICGNIMQATRVINQQVEITVLILAPILILFIAFAKFGVTLLYSDQFVSINGMLQWAALGMFFKAASFPIAYIFLAKGDSKRFLINETIANSYFLLLTIFGYKYAGLDGVGFSFLIGYFLYFLQVCVISRMKYHYKISKSCITILFFQFFLSIICFVSIIFLPLNFSYIIKISLILVVSTISIVELNKRLNILDYIANYNK